MTDKGTHKYSTISERHEAFRGGGIKKKPPFSIKRVIIFFIMISVIVLVAVSLIYLF